MAITDWWADYSDADNFLYPLFHSASFGPGGNYAFYSDRVTDSLIVLARRTVDQSAREALYARIDSRIFEAAPWSISGLPWTSGRNTPASRVGCSGDLQRPALDQGSCCGSSVGGCSPRSPRCSVFSSSPFCC